MTKIHVLLLLIFLSISNFTNGQENVIAKIKEKIKSLKNLKYDITFKGLTGSNDTFKLKGNVIVERVKEDTLFGYRFIVKTKAQEFVYDGTSLSTVDHNNQRITIYHKRNESVQLKINVIHGTAGVLLLPDLIEDKFYFDKNKEASLKASISEDVKSNCWVLEYPLPDGDGATNTIKRVYINKNTYLPIRTTQTCDFASDKRYSELVISNLMVDFEDKEEAFLNISFPEPYSVTEFKSSELVFATLPNGVAPDFELEVLDNPNERIKLSALKNKLILLDFWGIYCGYCQVALPKLQKLAETYKDKLMVIGIVNDYREKTKILLEKRKIHFTNLFGDEKLFEKYKAYGVPLIYLIDGNGKVLYSHNSLDPVEAEIKKYLQAH